MKKKSYLEIRELKMRMYRKSLLRDISNIIKNNKKYIFDK